MSESEADWSTGAERVPIADTAADVLTVADGVKVGGAGNSFALESAPLPEPRPVCWPPAFGSGDLLVRLLWPLLIAMAAAGLIAMAVR